MLNNSTLALLDLLYSFCNDNFMGLLFSGFAPFARFGDNTVFHRGSSILRGSTLPVNLSQQTHDTSDNFHFHLILLIKVYTPDHRSTGDQKKSLIKAIERFKFMMAEKEKSALMPRRRCTNARHRSC